MNNFWKRKVPAFILTLVMLASLAPAALAVAHTESHKLNDWVIVKESTCKVAGSKVQTCSVPDCNYKEVTESLPLAAHSYPANWSYKNNDVHVKVCSVCKYEETQLHTHSTSGNITL